MSWWWLGQGWLVFLDRYQLSVFWYFPCNCVFGYWLTADTLMLSLWHILYFSFYCRVIIIIIIVFLLYFFFLSFVCVMIVYSVKWIRINLIFTHRNLNLNRSSIFPWSILERAARRPCETPAANINWTELQESQSVTPRRENVADNGRAIGTTRRTDVFSVPKCQQVSTNQH